MKIKTKQSVGLWFRQRMLLSPAQALLCSCIVATMSLSQAVVFSQENGSVDQQREPDLYEQLDLIHKEAELARKAKQFDAVETLRAKRSALLATSNSSNHVWVRSQKTINEAKQLFNGMQYRLAAKNLLNQWNEFEEEEEKRGRDAVYFGDIGALLFTICEAAKTVDLVLVQTVEKKRDDDVEQNNPLRNDKQDQNNKLGKKDDASLESSDPILTQEEMLRILKLCAEDPCQSEAITMLAYVESPKKANAFMRAENRPDLRARNQTLLTLGAEIENLGEIDVKDKTSVVVEYLKAESTNSVIEDLELYKQFLDPRGKMSFNDITGETYELVLNDSILGYLDNTPTVLRYGFKEWSGHAVRGLVVMNEKFPPLRLGSFPINSIELPIEELTLVTKKLVYGPELPKFEKLLQEYRDVCNGLEMAEKVQQGVATFLNANNLDSLDAIREKMFQDKLRASVDKFKTESDAGFANYTSAFPQNKFVVDTKLEDIKGKIDEWFTNIENLLPDDEAIDVIVGKVVGAKPNPQVPGNEAALEKWEKDAGSYRLITKSILYLAACGRQLNKAGVNANAFSAEKLFLDQYTQLFQMTFYLWEVSILLEKADRILNDFLIIKLKEKIEKYEDDRQLSNLDSIGVRQYSSLVDWTQREYRQGRILHKQAEILRKTIKGSGIFVEWDVTQNHFKFKDIRQLDFERFHKLQKIFPEVIEKSYQVIQTAMALRRPQLPKPEGERDPTFDDGIPGIKKLTRFVPGNLDYDKTAIRTRTEDQEEPALGDLTRANNAGVFLEELLEKQDFIEEITSQVFDEQIQLKGNKSIKKVKLGDLQFISVPLRQNMITADLRDLTNGSSVIFTGGDASTGGVHIDNLVGWKLDIEKQEALPARDLTVYPDSNSKLLFDLLSAGANRPELEPNGEADIADGFDDLAVQVRGKAIVGLTLNMLPLAKQKDSREKINALKKEDFDVTFGNIEASLSITDTEYVCDFGDGCRGFMVQGIGDDASRYLETEQWSQVTRKNVAIDPEQSLKSQGSQTLFNLTARSTGQETSSQRVTYTINDWIDLDANIVNDFLPKMYLMMPCFPGWVIYRDSLLRPAPTNHWNWVQPKTP